MGWRRRGLIKEKERDGITEEAYNRTKRGDESGNKFKQVTCEKV